MHHGKQVPAIDQMIAYIASDMAIAAVWNVQRGDAKLLKCNTHQPDGI
jgi:hypothetical protein